MTSKILDKSLGSLESLESLGSLKSLESLGSLESLVETFCYTNRSI